MRRATGWPAAALAAMLAGGCGEVPVRGTTAMINDGQNTDGDAVLRRIGLTLPPSVRIEHVDTTAGRDDAARLVAVMSDDEWRQLKLQLRGHGPGDFVLSADRNAFLAPDIDGWRPSAAAGLETTQLPWKHGREALNVGVAPAGAGQVRLFLFWHQN